MLKLEYVLWLPESVKGISALFIHVKISSQSFILRLPFFGGYKSFEMNHLMSMQFDQECVSVLGFSRFFKYELLIEIYPDFLIGANSDVVGIAVIHSKHALYCHRVLVISVFEELVEVLIECHIQNVLILRIHKVGEVIVIIHSHSELPHSEAGYCDQIIACYFEVRIKVIENVVASLLEGKVIHEWIERLLFYPQAIVSEASIGAWRATPITRLNPCGYLIVVDPHAGRHFQTFCSRVGEESAESLKRISTVALSVQEHSSWIY